jgi:hypothetical protein
MSNKYETFDDWFNEIENYGTRMERFLDEFGQHQGRERMIEWLRASWECAREEKNKSDVWTHWCVVRHETWNTWLDRCTHCGKRRDD